MSSNNANTPELLVKNKYFLAESPHWCPKRNLVYFVDINNKIVCSYNPKNKDLKEIMIDEPDCEGISFVVPVQLSDTDFVVGFKGTKLNGLSLLKWDTGKNTYQIKRLCDIDGDRSNNTANDGKADARGRIFVGTFDKDVKEPKGSIWRLGRDGKAERVADKFMLSNGLDFSPDGKTFYFVDSNTKKIYAFDFNLETGDLSNQREVFDAEHHKLGGFPDGIACDNDGNLWVCIMGPGLIAEVTPSMSGGPGTVLGTIKFPNTNSVTACCFGGDKMSDLYVTTAKLFDPDSENAGSLFVVKDLKSFKDGKVVKGQAGREASAFTVRN